MMAVIHDILFNMQTLYSVGLGILAAVFVAREQPLSGGFWGSIAIYAGLNAVILMIGIYLAVSGNTIAADGRNVIYFLYMAFLIVIMPGLFSMLRGQDDNRAALYFSMLALFNASVSWSMAARGLASWVAIGA